AVEFEISGDSEPAAPPAQPVAHTPAPVEAEEELVAPVEEIDLDEILAPPAPTAPVHKPAPAAEETEFELAQHYELVIDPEALVPPHARAPPQVPVAPTAQNATPPAGGFASDQFLNDLASEIDQLGIGQLTPTLSNTPSQPSAPSASNNGPVPASPVESGPL